jgi:hypothetical protein
VMKRQRCRKAASRPGNGEVAVVVGMVNSAFRSVNRFYYSRCFRLRKIHSPPSRPITRVNAAR